MNINQFELNCKKFIHNDLYPSNKVVQENTLLGETLSYLVLLIWCNHLGIKHEMVS